MLNYWCDEGEAFCEMLKRQKTGDMISPCGTHSRTQSVARPPAQLDRVASELYCSVTLAPNACCEIGSGSYKVLSSKAAPKTAAATIDSATTSRQVGFRSFQYESEDMRKSPSLDQTQRTHAVFLATGDTIRCEQTHTEIQFGNCF